MPRQSSPKAAKPIKAKPPLSVQDILLKAKNPRTRDSLTRVELMHAMLCFAEDLEMAVNNLQRVEQLRDSERNRAKEYFLAGARATRNRDLQIISIFSQATREYEDPGQALQKLLSFAALPDSAGDTVQVR